MGTRLSNLFGPNARLLRAFGGAAAPALGQQAFPVTWGGQIAALAKVRTRPNLIGNAAIVAAQKAAVDAVTDPNQKTAYDAMASRVAGYVLSPTPTPYAGGTDTDNVRGAQQIIEECALLWIATGNAAFYTRGYNELMNLCQLSNNGLATTLAPGAGVWVDWQQVAGGQMLSTAHAGYAAAIGLEWLYPMLTVVERAAIKFAILVRFVLPYGVAINPDSPSWLISAPNANRPGPNVMAVVAACIAICAFAICDTYELQAATALNQAKPSIDLYLSFMPDGSSHETQAYGRYAFDYLCLGRTALLYATGLTSFRVANEDARMQAIGLWQVDAAGMNNRYFNHGDCSRDIDGHALSGMWVSLTYGLTECSNVARTQAVNLVHWSRTGVGILVWWNGPQNQTALNARTPCRYYPTSLEVLLQVDWVATVGSAKPRVWLKGGNNAQNHNKLDSGEICVEIGGRPVFWIDNQFGKSTSLATNLCGPLPLFNGQGQSTTGTAFVETGNCVLTGSTPLAWVNYLAAYPASAGLSVLRRAGQIIDSGTVQLTEVWTGTVGQNHTFNYAVDTTDGVAPGTRPLGTGSRTVTWVKGGQTYKLYIITNGFTFTVAPAARAAGEQNSTNVWDITISANSLGSAQQIDIAIQDTALTSQDPSLLSVAGVPASQA